MAETVSAQVAVVGLGPVGATALRLLRAQDVDAIGIERDRAVFGQPRAVALDDEALRVLQAAGALPPLVADAPVRFRGRRGQVLVELPPRIAASGHPAIAFFSQPVLEAGLRDGLDGVLLGEEVVALRQDADGATLSLSGGRTVRAGFVLACDGARSPIRHALGIPLRGMTSSNRWLVVDVDPGVGRPKGGRAFEFSCDPRRPWVQGPMPGGLHRFEFVLAAGEGVEDAARLLGRVVDGDAPEIVRAAAYRFHARVAPRWRCGRVLLAGDAAHLAPPFAGQGLSAGLRDASSVTWRLAELAGGRAPVAVLDGYERERRPHVIATTALALGLGGLIQTRRPRAAALRDGVVTAARAVPGLEPWVQGGGWRPPSRVTGVRGLARSGRLLPQPGRLDGELGPGFALLAIDTPAPGGLAGVRSVTTEDPTGELGAFLGGHDRLALVRPDRFLVGVAPRSELHRLEAALARIRRATPPTQNHPGP